METRHSGLELDEDLVFQRKTWAVELAAGWVFMALIALASLIGLIDRGPLSRTRKGDPNTLQIEYERFIHLETPAQLQVRVSTDGPFSLQLPFEYVEKADVSCIVPQPVNEVSEDGVMTYLFAGRPGASDVLFELTARKVGSVKGFVQSGKNRVEFTQFVYP